jgi:uridylate kinase
MQHELDEADLVVLKLSGEALAGPDEAHPIFPYDPDTVLRVAQEIAVVKAQNPRRKIAVVVGGGNIFRGAKGASQGMDRTEADYFGMLATIQNGVTLKDMLKRVCNIKTTLYSALECNKVAVPYIRGKVLSDLDKGRVAILAGGVGRPFFTTDTGAASYALELGAKLLAKATNVKGVFNKDPKKYVDAEFLPFIDYDRATVDKLGVMDGEAWPMCQKQKLPIRIFSLKEAGNITRVLMGEPIGSLVMDPPSSSTRIQLPS